MIVPWCKSDTIPAQLSGYDAALSHEISRSIEQGKLEGKEGEMAVFPSYGKLPAKRILLAGVGSPDKLDRHILRKVLHTAYRQCLRDETAAIRLSLLASHFSADELVFEAATCLYSAAYTFDRYQEKLDKTPSRLSSLFIQIDRKAKDHAAVLREAEITGNAINLARDLVNTPANHMTPALFTEAALREAKNAGFGLQILEQKDIQELGMEALLAVSRGSTEPPKFLILEHNTGRTDLPTVVLAGKGVTFDSGGISIKPSRNMHEMKTDMAGAAAVVGTLSVASQLKLPLHLVGLTPLTENMPDGRATRPGDIVKAMNGKTIEILNTDAEGRLILGDTLCYAERFKPDYLIDLATLTGACIVALGHEAAAVLGNNAHLIDLLKQASGLCDERIWQLPIWEEYREDLKSDIADIANIGKSGAAGTIEGAAFLEAFAGSQAWAHLDIAGVANTTKPRFYSIPGATGYGVSLLLQFLKLLSTTGV